MTTFREEEGQAGPEVFDGYVHSLDQQQVGLGGQSRAEQELDCVGLAHGFLDWCSL
jgi:hypothetical protein